MSQIKNRHPQTYEFLCAIDAMELSEKELDQLISEYKWHRKQNIAIVSSSTITNIFTNTHIPDDLGEIEFLDEKFQEMKSRSGPHDYLMVDFTTTPPVEKLYTDVFECENDEEVF